MRKIFSIVVIALITILITGCSQQETLKVAATSVPHAEILEYVEPILKDEYGITLEIVVVQDYVTPNQFLDNKDVDANYFQHIPYFKNQLDEFGYDFANAGGVHIEPIGIYSNDYTSIDELPYGATIIFSSSVADHGRILALLESAGLIELADVEKVDATIEDIIRNPKNLVFKSDIEASLLPTAYNNNEGDAIIINTNYALQAGLNPLEDAIFLENEDSLFVNIVAVRSEDLELNKIKILIEVLSSGEVVRFINQNYGGAVVAIH